MSRIRPVPPEEASQRVKEAYAILKQKIGSLPNIFLHMGHSEPALRTYLSLSEAASHGVFPAQLREKIALTVAEANHCNYCLAAHTAIAHGLGVDNADILEARLGHSQDKKTGAILEFVKKVVEQRAQISSQEVARLKELGVTDQELVDLVALITLNIFTNYFNLIADPKVDFPPAPEIG